MNLKEYIYKQIKVTLNERISEGRPIPMDTPNEFVYIDFKKYAYKNRKMFKKELQKSKGDGMRMNLTLSALWYKWARKNHKEFTHIKDNQKFGRALMVMMVKDDLIFSIDAFRKTNNITKLKEYGHIVPNDAIEEKSEEEKAKYVKGYEPIEEKDSKRDYKKEYEKYGKSKKAKKYRAELNKYNRQKGTYGNGDGKDASHKGGKIVGFEDESKNRGRREKSRLKKEATFVPVSGTKAGGTLHLDNRKYQLKKDVKDVQIGTYIVTLPKGTILYNLAGGVLADHKSLEQYETRSQRYFKKSTYRGIMIRQKEQTIRDIEKNSKVLESVNEAKGLKDVLKVMNVGLKKAIKKGITTLGYAKDYIKSLERMAKKNTKQFFKDYGDFTEDDWIEDIRYNMANENINEAKFYITRNLGRGQGKALVGGYDLKRDKKLPPKVFKSYKDAQKEVERLERGGSMGGQMTAYFVTDKDMNMLKPNGKKMFESINEAKVNYNFSEDELKRVLKLLGRSASTEIKMIKAFEKAFGRKLTRDELFESLNEEQLDEKLITFSNRAPYGQIVFMAGGAGSGKGFAIDNFIDGAGFKVRDVDEMKKQLGRLDALGKFSVDKWYKKFGKNLSTKPPKKNPKGMSPKEHIEEFVLGKGLSISDISKDLKNPINVASLHYIVDAMKLKDKWLISMLSGKDNKETLPNLLFDITAKKVSSITDVLKPLMDAGYDSKNVHLIWVLTNYVVAVDRNKTRDRVVPDDILLQTHEGAGKTIWELLTNAVPKGLNGRIDVILNNSENTIYHIQPSVRKGKKVGIVSDFKSLSVKKQGGGITPEKVWKEELYNWIKKNAPQTLDLDQELNKAIIKKKDETTTDYMI